MPEEVADNRNQLVLRSSRRGSPDKLSRVGIDGPKISVSKIPVLMPRRAKARARFTARMKFYLALFDREVYKEHTQ